MSGVIAPVRGNDRGQRASLKARLVVLCETIAQLRAAVLENHPADVTGEQRMGAAIPSVALLPDTCECSGSLNSRNSHHV